MASVSIEVFANAGYAPKATDRRSVSSGAIVCKKSACVLFSKKNINTYKPSEHPPSGGKCQNVVVLNGFPNASRSSTREKPIVILYKRRSQGKQQQQFLGVLAMEFSHESMSLHDID